MFVIRNLLEISLMFGFFYVVCWLFGKAFSIRIEPRRQDYRFLDLVIVGLTVLLALTYLSNIFVPINGDGFSVIFTLGLFFVVIRCCRSKSIYQKDYSIRRFISRLKRRKLKWLRLGLGLWLVCFVALSRAIAAQATNYDSYLYHFQIIDYFSYEKAVIGLGNLHSRLGFNSGIYPLASLFSKGPWGENGYRLANGFIVMLGFIDFSSRFRAINQCGFKREHLPSIFGLPIVLSFAFVEPGYWIASPGPDVSSGVLSIIAVSYFIRAVDDGNHLNIQLAVSSAVLAFSFRPINAVVLVFSIALIFRYRSFYSKQKIFRNIQLFLPALSLMTAVSIHSVVRTGYLFYPFPISFEIFNWTIPSDIMKEDLMWIESWAKSPGSNPQDILGNWQWVSSWWSSNISGLTNFLVLALVCSCLLVVGLSTRHLSLAKNNLLILFLVILPMYVWLSSGPDIRFALGQLSVVAVSPLLLVESRKSPEGLGRLVWRTTVISVVILISIEFIQNDLLILNSEQLFAGMNQKITNQLPVVQSTEPFMTLNDVVFSKPSNGSDQCVRQRWCTPYPNFELQLKSFLGWTLLRG